MTDDERSDEPRERAFSALYEADQKHSRLSDDLNGRVARLATGTMRNVFEIDAAIESAAERWTLDRMPVVDRALLRLATYELKYEPHTPTAVILSEAVRIAKRYSTENSARFINGVLSTIAIQARSSEEEE